MKRAYRNLTSAAFVLAMTTIATGCPGGTDNGLNDRAPYRDAWAVVADLAFVHTSSEGVEIGSVNIGGRLTNDNFANRGDGVFDDRSEEAGLAGLGGGLNLTHADADGDGALDLFVLRGAWCRTAEAPW